MALLWSNGIKLRKKPNAKNQTKNKLRQFIKSLSLVYSKNKTACKTGSNYNLNQFTKLKIVGHGLDSQSPDFVHD